MSLSCSSVILVAPYIYCGGDWPGLIPWATSLPLYQMGRLQPRINRFTLKRQQGKDRLMHPPQALAGDEAPQ
jgi:hypothetical protein